MLIAILKQIIIPTSKSFLAYVSAGEVWDQTKDLFQPCTPDSSWMSCLQVSETQSPRKLMFQQLSFSPFSNFYPPEVRGSPSNFATRLFSLGRMGSFPISTSSNNTSDRFQSSHCEGQQAAEERHQSDADRTDIGETEERKSKNIHPEGAREETVNNDELLYEAESPDEAALVHAAHVYGFTLRDRSADHVLVDVPGVGSVVVQLLHILPFDSNRKRMSVVVRHPLSGQVVVYTKGADSVIMDLSQNPKGKNPWFPGDVCCAFACQWFSVFSWCVQI